MYLCIYVSIVYVQTHNKYTHSLFLSSHYTRIERHTLVTINTYTHYNVSVSLYPYTQSTLNCPFLQFHPKFTNFIKSSNFYQCISCSIFQDIYAFYFLKMAFFVLAQRKGSLVCVLYFAILYVPSHTWLLGLQFQRNQAFGL